MQRRIAISPGKYLIELPLYLFPWTLLVIAAARRACGSAEPRRMTIVPCALRSQRRCRLCSFSRSPLRHATFYLAPALPGFALLVGWWAREILPGPDSWDVRALRATAAMLLLGVAVFAAALAVLGAGDWERVRPCHYVAVSLAGLSAAAILAVRAWAAAREHAVHAQWALLLAYCALSSGPRRRLYRRVDAWQDLAKIGRAVERDAREGRLFCSRRMETTRAVIDMYARQSVAG